MECARSYSFLALHSRYHMSASSGDLIVPRTRTVTYGPRSFSFSGSTTWNALPTDIRDPLLTLKQFSTKLKTVMFTRAYYARP